MDSDYNLASLRYLANGKQSPQEIHRIARGLFNRSLRQGKLRQVWGKLAGRRVALCSLAHLPAARSASHSHHVNFVPLERIVGSEGRSGEFDNQFNPLKSHNQERWIGIAIARRAGVVLPPVELVQDGDEYYVRDGHHRISVAKALGQLEIEALIVN